MDDRGGLDKVVGGLQCGVALAENQHALVDEVVGVHRYHGIVLGGLETYGTAFAEILRLKPASAFLADGSSIEVFAGEKVS